MTNAQVAADAFRAAGVEFTPKRAEDVLQRIIGLASAAGAKVEVAIGGDVLVSCGPTARDILFHKLES